MKVFTVGLDQKPVEENKEKTDSPPPGYSTTETRIPLPMGPELPRPSLPIPPPQPIIVRKSRGYKGILLVMLSVFLMAIFALVLSEMAYSRQRDENYFKLRWAELKQRFGYENDGNVDYYTHAANAISDKLLSLTKSNEIQLPRVPQSASLEEETTSSSTTQDTPVVAIDTFPMAPSKIGNSADSSISRSSQTSDEVEPPHPFFGSGNFNGAFSQIRDARLKFLRNILQKIKQHAEDIVEVEPQNSDSSSTSNEDNNNNNLLSNGNWPSSIFQRPQQQVLQFPQSSSAHFFPHPRPLVEDFKNSRSFLDGFGEMHQPSLFMQNNQVGEQEEQQRPRFFSPWALQQNELPSSHPIMPSGDMQQQQQIPSFIDKFLRWPRINGFHWAHPQQNSFGFGGNSGVLPRPSSFEHWNNGPEAKLSAPSVVIGDSGEEKSQVIQQPGQQPQQPKQPEQKESSWMTPDLLPAWLFDNLSSRKSNAAGGPPSPQQPAEMAPPKFPSVSVIENNPSGSKSESDSKSSIDEGNSRSDETENTPSRLSADALPVETPKVIDIAHGEIGKINNNNKDDKDDGKDDTIGNSHQPEEVIEVDAAPQLNEQQTEQKNDEQKNEQNESKDQKEDQPKEQKDDEKTEAKPVNVPLQQQKLFPEMPSVFFQVDDPANDHQAAAIQPAQDNLHLAERA
uniref:Uncharacterized protein n=1 Tax=Meloidogyne javanica TaxID=6303 RepID=A0A915N8S1_MELJA